MPADAFKEFFAPYPDIEEQRAIVAFLDFELSRIDDLLSECHRLVQLLSEKRKSLIDVAMNDKNTEKVRLQFCTRTISREINRQDETLYEPIGVLNRGRGLFHKNKVLGKDLGSSTFFHVEPGDLIISGQFAWEGSVAIAGESEAGCIVSHRYPVLRGVESLDTTFLWAYFTTREGDFVLNQHSNGAAGRNRPLNLSSLLKEKVPVPPKELQKPVIEIVKKEIRLRDQVKEIESFIREHKTSLINSAVTGKIDVRNYKQEAA